MTKLARKDNPSDAEPSAATGALDGPSQSVSPQPVPVNGVLTIFTTWARCIVKH